MGKWDKYLVTEDAHSSASKWDKYAVSDRPQVDATVAQPETAMQRFLGNPVVQPIVGAARAYMGARNYVGDVISSMAPNTPKVPVPSFIPTPFGSFQTNTPMTGKEIAGDAGRMAFDEAATFGAGHAIKAVGKVAPIALDAGKAFFRGISRIPEDISLVRRGGSIESAPLAFQKYINQAKSVGKTAVEDARVAFRDSNITLGKKIQNAAESGGRQAQTELASNLRKVSPKYGEKLSEIFSNAKGRLSNSDALDIGEATLAELKAKELGNSDVEGIIQSFIDKVKAVKVSPIVDEFGKPITTSVRNANDAIDFQELNNLRTKVMEELSTRGKKLGDFNQADLASIIFNRNMTEKMAPHVPELQGLRGEYAKFKKIAEEAYRIVRPKTGEYNTRGIENLIKRNALGKASIGERDLIKAIQDGTDLLPGSKDFSSEAKAFGDELLKLKSEHPKRLLEIQRQTRKTVEELENQKNLAKQQVIELKRAKSKLKWIGGLITGGGTLAGYRAMTQ